MIVAAIVVAPKHVKPPAVTLKKLVADGRLRRVYDE